MGSKTDKYILNDESQSSGSSSPRLINYDLSPSVDDDLTLVWLDRELHIHPKNIEIQIKMKNLINSFRTFTDVPAFIEFIESNQANLFVIISPDLSLTLIRYVHDLPQLEHIYIYKSSRVYRKVLEQTVKNYSKV
ncbi:unnamed protein product [Adineta ricciae]|uniref:Uncharacterized protein n=1 Tax=Adineta ricciae TaxID=249248 RepID=A0A814QAC3_ADIRI|nr:unnamed protein product [Adineta ricciae]CAF1567058.1 unnamed protein product [Adineta ricciae]